MHYSGLYELKCFRVKLIMHSTWYVVDQQLSCLEIYIDGMKYT